VRSNGKPIKSIREVFKGACLRAGIRDFQFRDLRHCFVTRKRREGKDYLSIRKITGHKTNSVFERYNAFNVEDLQLVVENSLNLSMKNNVP